MSWWRRRPCVAEPAQEEASVSAAARADFGRLFPMCAMWYGWDDAAVVFDPIVYISFCGVVGVGGAGDDKSENAWSRLGGGSGDRCPGDECCARKRRRRTRLQSRRVCGSPCFSWDGGWQSMHVHGGRALGATRRDEAGVSGWACDFSSVGSVGGMCETREMREDVLY